MAVRRFIRTEVTAGAPDAPIYYLCDLESDLPVEGLFQGDLAFTKDTNKYWKATDSTTWASVAGSGGNVAWGDVEGTLSDQTDLQTALDAKQASDADLTTIAGLTATTDNFMVAAASAWASRTPAQAKTSLALVKGDVGLGNVDNTSDAAKPVSTATQTALDGKAAALGADDNYVTDAEKTVIGNTSGTNTGDQTLPVKATGAEIDTGTDDAKFATAKAIEDSAYIKAAYADAKVADEINNGTTTIAPSQNAVFDALALKGVGDMVLASTQSVTGAKTFDPGMLKVSGGDGVVSLTTPNTPGNATVTLPKTTGTLALNTVTAGVGTSPTSSSTTQITHNLGRVPTVIRIHGRDTFLANAAALPPTGSTGIWCSTGNLCVYQPYDPSTVTAAEPAATSVVYAIRQQTGVGNFITGVIGNVGATTFDIVWTETGTHTAQVYMWEAS